MDKMVQITWSTYVCQLENLENTENKKKGGGIGYFQIFFKNLENTGNL